MEPAAQKRPRQTVAKNIVPLSEMLYFCTGLYPVPQGGTFKYHMTFF